MISPSTTNVEEEEIVDAPGMDGNASMPEQVKRPNPYDDDDELEHNFHVTQQAAKVP
jgi:hypothetical protein